MTPPVRLLLGAVVATVFVASASAQVTRNTAPVPPPAPNPANSADQGNIDLAYGAFQRGHYLTAFNEASKRAQQNDPAAMTLLGEIYAQGLGVGRDDSKAAQWYKMAAAKGDRDALFALAMFNFQGRATTKNLEEAARLLEAAAKLGHAGAAYDLGLLYLQGQQFPQDIKRAGELFALAAEGGNSEAQYALATLYKEGRGVPKDMRKAMLLMQQASVAGNLDAMVEFAIALFNGEGVNKDEAAAAQLFLKAAHLGNADRAKPPGADPDGRPRHARGRYRGDQMASGRPRRAAAAIPTSTSSPQNRAQRSARPPKRRPRNGCRPRRPAAPLTALAFAGRPLAACMHSALLNVMIAAARKAARALKRDFGEVENLQVSLKGPGNFVTAADRRAEETLYAELMKARPGYGFLGEEGGRREGADKTHPGSSIRSTAPPISCTASRISPSRSHSSAKARWSPA